MQNWNFRLNYNEHENQLNLFSYTLDRLTAVLISLRDVLVTSPLPLLWASCSLVRTVPADEALMLPDAPGGGGEMAAIGMEVPTLASFVNDARIVIN